ncbi:MAG: hypothetical protein AABX16_01015 [Nanoarchaeota archaeon]
MAMMEMISQLKNQGMPTGQIIQSLKEQGYSPKEINEALSQVDIKSEINTSSQTYPLYAPDIPQQGFTLADLRDPNAQQQPGFPPDMQMQPSMDSQVSPPRNEEYAQIDQQTAMPYPEYAPAPEQYAAADYPQYSAPSQSIDVETISDITTQILEEKLKTIKKELQLSTHFRKEAVEKINTIDKKIEKIENTLAELQMAIIKKIGEYGENMENISKELKATQDSFSKMLNPLTDTYREMQKQNVKKEEK